MSDWEDYDSAEWRAFSERLRQLAADNETQLETLIRLVKTGEFLPDVRKVVISTC